jgi:hypothetical protein
VGAKLFKADRRTDTHMTKLTGPFEILLTRLRSSPQEEIYACLLAPWSRVLLEKLTSKLVKKFPAFMELESHSPYPQSARYLSLF